MKTVLILIGCYLPGYRYGGPVSTVKNVTEALGEEYDFRIVCPDRDYGAHEPYPNIPRGEWTQVGKARVWYAAPGEFGFSLIRRLAAQADVVYAWGFFAYFGYKTLILNRLNLLHGKRVAVAPMGTLSAEALSQKKVKKRCFLTLCRALGLFRGVLWSVTSEQEARDLKREVGRNARYVIAEDLPRAEAPGRTAFSSPEDGLRVAFLSRIVPQKNLLGAVRALRSVKGTVCFRIYGPTPDQRYWNRCQRELQQLPANVTWEYCGGVPSESVQSTLAGNDVFLFPTRTESYGHVIFEALSVGCIPVISDRTIWDDIARKNAGFVIPLEDTDEMAACIDRIGGMPIAQRRALAENAVALAREKIRQSRKQTGYRTIFEGEAY